LEEWQSSPISNYRFKINNGLGGTKNTFLKLLANNQLKTEDRQNLLEVDRRLFNRFERYKTQNPSFPNNPKPKPKLKLKYLGVRDEDEKK
jgi:hypothetical protein